MNKKPSFLSRIKPVGWILILLILSALAFFTLKGIIIPNLDAKSKTPVATDQRQVQDSSTDSPSPQKTTELQPTQANASAPASTPMQTTSENAQDNRPEVKIWVDQFGPYFVALQIAQDDSLPFKLDVVPLGFNEEVGNPNEEERGRALFNGEMDVLLTSDASLSRMGNIGEIKFIIDQSWGVDEIIVKNIASDGTPISSFNDLKGKTICVAQGNVNHFMILAALRVAGIDPLEDVNWVYKNSVTDAVDQYVQGKCDVVGAWQPESTRAINDGAGKSLIDSSQWNNISDVAVFSFKSLSEKPEIMFSFSQAWMKHSKIQSDNLLESGEQIAKWQYNGQPTNDWTFVYPDSEVADMHIWNDGAAQAGLVENIASMQNLGYFRLMLNGKRDAWSRAGMIVDIAPYNAETIINPDFIFRMQDDFSLINTGTFPNSNYQPLPENLPNADANQLLGISTIVKLPCETFSFEPNSTSLTKEGVAEVQNCATAARDMVLSSSGQILITGSSAWPAGYNETQVEKTALGRANAILTEFLRMGVPASRMAIFVSLPPDKDQSSYDEAVNQKYRFTRIEIKVTGR